jgi:hypothetical protein
MSIEDLQLAIEKARERAQTVFDARCRVAGMLSGAVGISTTELEFPEPDVMHAYLCIFGRRPSEPIVYKLAFRDDRPVKWIGIAHPWGVKPADIVV